MRFALASAGLAMAFVAQSAMSAPAEMRQGCKREESFCIGKNFCFIESTEIEGTCYADNSDTDRTSCCDMVNQYPQGTAACYQGPSKDSPNQKITKIVCPLPPQGA